MKRTKRSKPVVSIDGKDVVLDSPLEKLVIDLLNELKCEFKYHPKSVYYFTEPKRSRYTPDLELPNGVFIEIKGYLRPKDIEKHLLIKKQIPDFDLRFVFDNASKKITGRKHLTYAKWCEKHNFMYCEKVIPPDWLF